MLQQLSQSAPLPAWRNLEGNFVGGDLGQGLLGAEFLGRDKAGLFCLDAFEKFTRWLHVRVSGAPVSSQFALYRFLQDGLLELVEEKLLVGDFALRGRNASPPPVDPLDELMLLGERWEIDFVV